MFVSCECRVLSGRGLCDELITRPEESYRLWCAVVCDLETLRMKRLRPALGRSATGKRAWNLAFRWPCILICFSFLLKKSTRRTISQINFGKKNYIFQTVLLSITSRLDTVFTATGIGHIIYVCQRGRGFNLASRQSTQIVWQIPIVVNTVSRLLIMDSRTVRNMKSSVPKWRWEIVHFVWILL
jgi:hypothetical protein